MDELDTQLAQELKEQREEAPGQEPEAVVETKEEEVKEAPKEQPKVYDEEYVKALRRENAKYRVQLRQTQQRYPSQQGYGQNQYQGNPQEGYPNEVYQQPNQQGYQQPVQEYYDPRVDDMILESKLSSIKADPYFAEILNDEDEEGRTFEERLLEKAIETQWPVAELDALALKMERDKIIGKVKQKTIDETYKNISTKASSAADKSVSSGKNVDDGEVTNVEDAIKKTMRQYGVNNLSELG